MFKLFFEKFLQPNDFNSSFTVNKTIVPLPNVILNIRRITFTVGVAKYAFIAIINKQISGKSIRVNVRIVSVTYEKARRKNNIHSILNNIVSTALNILQ